MKNLLKTVLLVGGAVWAINKIDEKLKEKDIDLIEEGKKLIRKQLEPKSDEKPS